MKVVIWNYINPINKKGFSFYNIYVIDETIYCLLLDRAPFAVGRVIDDEERIGLVVCFEESEILQRLNYLADWSQVTDLQVIVNRVARLLDNPPIDNNLWDNIPVDIQELILSKLSDYLVDLIGVEEVDS